MTSMVRSDNIRKRNVFLALALSFVAVTFLFYVDEGGMKWMMWRDSTLLAVAFIAAGVVFGFLWWRTPRE